MEPKFPVRNFRKFGYTSRGCPFFPEIPENAVPFVTGNFRKFKPEFFIEWKAPINVNSNTQN